MRQNRFDRRACCWRNCVFEAMESVSELSEMWKLKLQNIIDSFFKDKKNSNSILELEELLLSDDETCILESMNFVRELFENVFNKNMMNKVPSLDEAQETYRRWLVDRYSDFISHLLGYLSHINIDIQKKALHILLTFVQLEGKYPLKSVEEESGVFPMLLFEKILTELASLSIDQQQLIQEFEAYTVYDDVKLYLLKAVQKILEETEKFSDIFLQNCFYLLCSFEYPKFQLDKDISAPSNTLLSKIGVQSSFQLKEKEFRKTFSSVWLRILKCELPTDLYKKVLIVMHEKILKYLTNPWMLTDFLTDSYNQGGETSLLALSGLFMLMQKHNVEYPDFFIKLYALFTEDIVNGEFSAKFFHLSDMFLSSTHLPAYIVAAFVKKLSRISLRSKTSTILCIIPLVCNLLIRHPSLKILIHRTDLKECSSDPFDVTAVNPAESKALESSLWEIKSLQFHVNPDVSRKAKLINAELPKIEFTLPKAENLTMEELYRKTRKRKYVEVPLAIKKPEPEEWWILSKKVVNCK